MGRGLYTDLTTPAVSANTFLRSTRDDPPEQKERGFPRIPPSPFPYRKIPVFRNTGTVSPFKFQRSSTGVLSVLRRDINKTQEYLGP